MKMYFKYSSRIGFRCKTIKKMKINDVFYRFTSKAYSAAILSINFHLDQIKVPKKLTQKFSIFSEISGEIVCDLNNAQHDKIQMTRISF